MKSDSSISNVSYFLFYRALKYGSLFPIILSAFPAVAVATKIFQVNRFTLWGPGKLMIGMVGTLMPAVSSAFANVYIQRDVLLGLTPCSVCLEIKAVCLQMLAGIIVPSTIGIMAANHQLVGQAWKKNWMPGICITKKDLMKCKNIVLVNAVLQAAAVSFLLYRQQTEWVYVQKELERRRDSDREYNAYSDQKPSGSLITKLD